MPLLRITHQADAFTTAQKVQLAEDLTHAILMAERGLGYFITCRVTRRVLC